MDEKTESELPNAPRFWAKTLPDGSPGIDVHQHMLRVGAVASVLAKDRGTWFRQLGIEPDVASGLAGLHDIGKISQGFQSKCPAWLQQNGLVEVATRQAWENMQRDHSRIGQFTLQRLLIEQQAGLKRSTANWWAAAVGCHHGRIHNPAERGLPPEAGMSEDQWEETRRLAAMRFFTDFGSDLRGLASRPVTPESAVLWAVAGLTSVADWIGSDENIFPTDRDLPIPQIRTRAAETIESLGLRIPHVKQGLSFRDLFDFEPYGLQRAAQEFIRRPGLYIIEAPMGMGKTEAALAVAYQLLSDGLATGIYFALPTQATSNRIHSRLDAFVRRVCPDALSTRLIHSSSWLIEDLVQPRPGATSRGVDDARQGRDWFASTKRALLAPFGVGTVDQALLSIVAAKHFFVRRFALAGKVVIVDEVHSYDVYTGTLVGKLCEELGRLGCTVILLSATLTRARRHAILPELGENQALGTDPYPLISGVPASGEVLPSRSAEGPVPKTVSISFRSEDEALRHVESPAKTGACCLWICNTVDRAQAVRRRLRSLGEHGVAVGLLHARFPFFRRQVLEEEWMKALGKDGARSSGCVLVSTQIVEQSVDLDADLMISELAPTDMLLQRMGRLWRHPRASRAVSEPEFWVLREALTLEALRTLDAAAIKRVLGPKAWVYAPYVLLRTMEVWNGRQTINVPEDIRELLEGTYAEIDDLPPGWEQLRDQIEGNRFAEKMMANRKTTLFDVALPDDEGVQTRLDSVPAVSLVLASERSGSALTLLNGDHVGLEGDEFSLHAARALHRNLVRVPKRRVFSSFRNADETARYIRGEQAVAMVDGHGEVSVPGLKGGIRLHWDPDLGLEILALEGSEDDESRD